MPDYKLVRLVRTASSEVYLLWEGAQRVGQVDIHYADSLIHVTIILEQALEREEVDNIIAQLDDDVISSYLPDFERDDLLVNVYSGEELLSYPEEDDSDDDGDE